TPISTVSSFKPELQGTFPSSLWLKFDWLGEPIGDRPLTGQIVESGTHEELLARGDRYAYLHSQQFQT
ncbi:hypothetical protein, partial [Halomicronema sp. CCY15110]|uniref:hypothetical protein n=1 Tax=Halomicronema sp. CCY15110 TaxID=2767773 RepID=UPI00194F80A9